MKRRSLKAAIATVLVAAMVAGCGAQTPKVENEKQETATQTEVQTTVSSETVADAEGTEASAEVEAGPVVEYKEDGMTWQNFLKEMGAGWNLGNTFDSIECNWVSNELDYEGAWIPNGPKTTKEMILLAKDAGFSTIRIPVSWHNHVDVQQDEKGSYTFTISPQWLARVREVVDYCYEEDLYVIINIHHDDEKYGHLYPTEERKDESLAYITQIWTQLATEFAEYDLHVIFEIMNEVRLYGTADEWDANASNSKNAQKIMNEYAQAAVNAIRAIDKGYNASRFIAVPGYAASIDSKDKYVLPSDPGGYADRIIVAIHAYSPYSFCMDTSNNGKSVFDDGVRESVKYLFRTINKEFTSKGIPAYIGEWGTVLKADNAEERIKHAEYYTQSAMTFCKDENGEVVTIPCVLWDNGFMGDPSENEVYGYMDRTNITWYDNDYIEAINSSYHNAE